MNKPVQKYLALIQMAPNGAGPIYQAIMEWKDQPIEGVKLQEAFQVFGKWDFAIIFQAESNDNALHFVGDVVRQVEGVKTMMTIPFIPIKKWQ
jgi:uncharacterized protein with GYD domain